MNSFDIETFNHNNKLIPYCVTCIIDEKESSYFGLNCVDDFLENIKNIGLKKKTDKKKKIYIFSHNLTFDASIIIQNSKKNKISYDGLFFKGNIYFLEINLGDVSVILKCSYRFFPRKLSDAHAILGTKKKIEFNHEMVSYDNFESFKNESVVYCLNDSRIVYEIVLIYNKIFSRLLKNWYVDNHSLPGLSYKIFNKIYNNYGVEISSSSDYDFLFRNSYFGGRCEVFGNPKKEELIYHFDFKGMYAQIMHDDFNYGDFEIIEKPLKIHENGFYYIYTFSDVDIPILPHRSNKDNKLMFTNGYVKGLFWWEEIRLFVDNGGIILDIKYWIKFKKKNKIFCEFTTELSKMREEGKENNSVCKFVINSLYGRMGMGEMVSETKLLNTKEYYDFCIKNEKRIIKESWINDVVFLEFEKIKENLTVNSNVALAAMITAKARIKLFKGFKSVLENGGRILYCDTDSIFAAFNKNVDNEKFGEIFFDTTKKDTKIKKALFALPKAYSLTFYNNESVTKIKGFNNIEINFDEFKKTFNEKSKIKTIISILKKSNFIITPENVEKIIFLGDYNKRIFTNNYKFTKPYYIDITQEKYEIKNKLILTNCEKILKYKSKENNVCFKIDISKNTIILFDVVLKFNPSWVSFSYNTVEDVWKYKHIIKILIANNFSNADFKICNDGVIENTIKEKITTNPNVVFNGNYKKLIKYFK